VTGTTAMFSVAATGDQPLFYEWQENGTNINDGGNISGSATSSLTLVNVTTLNTGSYSVIVSNALYAVSSLKATLTVVPNASPSAAMNELRLFTGGIDGAFPYAGLIQGKDGNLYGTAEGGGLSFYGSIFRMTLAGGLTTLYSFTDGNNGANPHARLVQGTNGNFYGTTDSGGTNGYGTIFKMTSGGVVSFLHSFTGGGDGADSQTGLTPGADGNFYGASYQGGANSFGSIYKMAPNGAVTAVYEFTGSADGAYPYADLVQGKDGHFYGTTLEGGANGYGTVFGLTTNGTLTTLASFNYTNGAYPQAGVILGTDGSFYGTTLEGGAGGYGTVFNLTTNGTLTTLLSFGLTNGSSPAAALVQASDGNFYGTTPLGGTGYNPSAGGGNGTVFRLIVPLFTNSQFTVASAVACLAYSSTLS